MEAQTEKKLKVVSTKSLLETGVHFGHPTRLRNPKMQRYIYGQPRKDVHIIDLKQTEALIEVAYAALYDIVAAGGRVLFVGTRKQAQEAIKDEAVRTGQYYVDNRWLGGTLTNFKTIRERVKLLQRLEEQQKEFDAEEEKNVRPEERKSIWSKLPKKEVLDLKHLMYKLERNLGGIKEMKSLPQAVYVVDPGSEEIAVKEAKKLGIPVFAIVDTNRDPDLIDYVIPANDDAIRAVKYITWVMGNAILEAKGEVVEKYEDEPNPFAAEYQQERPKRETTPKREATPKKEASAKKEAKVAADAKDEVVADVPAETPASETPAPKALGEMTLAELKAVAKAKNIENYTTLKKAELLEILTKE